MNRIHFISLIGVFACSLSANFVCGQSDLEQKLQNAADRATVETYLIRYKLNKGETVSYEVEQVATVNTTIAKNNQKTKLRSASVRSLSVNDVSSEGLITFDHTINEVDMWSEVDGRSPIKYNSKSDKEPPAEFENVAETVGKPISRITMSPLGKIVKRDDKIKQADLGMGGLSIPLPKERIKIGHKWAKPHTVRVRLANQQIKEIKTRELYELKKVVAGVATIALKTQILTPVKDAKIKSQLLQRISKGEIKFDIDAGRLISKQLDWDESVLGFNGPDSNMKYRARFTEKLMTNPTVKTAKRKSIRTKQ